jgi:hypothetical protein
MDYRTREREGVRRKLMIAGPDARLPHLRLSSSLSRAPKKRGFEFGKARLLPSPEFK